jgi:predicted alpha-1,2-mannosidase
MLCAVPFPRHRPSVTVAIAIAITLIAAACSGSRARAGGTATGPTGVPSGAPTPVSAPSALVNPFMGTGVGGRAVGNVNASPAADVPFGMMQWGPDTSPHRALGGGYTAGDRAVSGFSLTHLNGPGCAALGDVPILPTVGAVGGEPELATAQFAPGSQRAAPGRYSVQLPGSHIGVALAVATHSGLGRFTFPATSEANVLFKVADSAVPAENAHTEVIGDREVAGWVVSGHFCDTAGTYRLAFDAVFNRPFRHFATWQGATVAASNRQQDGQHSGAIVSFDTRRDRAVTVAVGISFVSIANARANRVAEARGFDLGPVTRAATAAWDRMLGRVQIAGGTHAQQATFYSALYRSLLHPNVFSDVNGEYPGFDGRTHTTGGYTQYANFSGWDIYRSEVPLLALLAPTEVSNMMRSLLADDAQHGFLPKLAYTDGDAGEMNGDSADPIVAGAYAFGVRGFDAGAALRAMVKGATTAGTGLGWDVARQDLDEYLKQGWVEVGRRDRTSFDYTIGGSETLEYAIDDAAIAQLAASLGQPATAQTFAARAANWRHLFDPAAGYLEARDANGKFPTGPAFQPSPLPNIGQDGWEEGNAIQYTWSVPQDLRGLFDAMGGNATAVRKLDRFFTALNTSRKQPHDWAGNEPALGIPWEYDYAGAPWRTQDVVRRVADLYAPAPNGEPGNDDLGAMASWYVWAAVGLYPETPGRADLVLASPLFPRVVITLGSGKKITIDAPAASDRNRYVQRLTAGGFDAPPACGTGASGYGCPWVPASVITTGARLHFVLGPKPNREWGIAAAAAPPSMTAK